jgi:DNA-binding response OmpR family regulator
MEKRKILLVEDEEDLLATMRIRLEANNYSVITAVDGQEALDKARGQSPDLIVLDLMLPKIDGYKVCRMLKFDEKYKKIPIVIVTARAQEEDIQLGMEVGANAYFTKPIDSKKLLEKIEELLRWR